MISQFPTTKLEFVQFVGGLDQISSHITRHPGTVQEAQNFEVDTYGGYTRIAGYERFDGNESPHSAEYAILPAAISGGYAVGNTLTGVTSAATAIIAGTDATGFVITNITGSFDPAETLNISGSPVATTTASEQIAGATDTNLHAQYLNLAADIYRTSIQAVPGSGNILGVWVYNDVVYAFRNNAGGTAAVMYKSTASGWSLVTTPALLPNGRFSFINANFGGATNTTKMYGCDGVNKAFQFDGTTFTQITTGMTVDAPTFIASHMNHLFLGFGGSLQHSAIGDPLSWTPVLGAGEIALGDTITGLLPMPGSQGTGALLAVTRNTAFILYGTSSANWNLVTIQNETGGVAYTLQSVGAAYMMDDRGLMQIGVSQNFGNFDQSTLSQAIRPFISERISRLSCSSINRSKNQYRAFFNDGYGIYMTLENAKSAGLMPVYFPNPALVAVSAEFSSGLERSFFGSSNGFIYELDVGTSFDGEPIEAYFRTSYLSLKSPRFRKHFRKIAFEVTGVGYAEFSVNYDFDYGTPDIAAGVEQTAVTNFVASFWDVSDWDRFYWDGRNIMPSEMHISGTGENVSLLIYSNSDIFAPYRLTGGLIHFTMRRQMR